MVYVKPTIILCELDLTINSMAGKNYQCQDHGCCVKEDYRSM